MRGRPLKYSSETIERVRQMYVEGARIAAISAQAGMPVSSLTLLVRKLKLPRRTAPHSDDRDREIARLWRDGMLHREIAAATGCKLGTVKTIIRRLGLADRRSGQRGRKERILDLWAAGRNSPQIAAELGIAAGTVRAILCLARQEGDRRARKRAAAEAR